MPDRIINIPEVGQVNFPASMSDTDVKTASHKLWAQALSKKAMDPKANYQSNAPAPTQTPTKLGNFMNAAAPHVLAAAPAVMGTAGGVAGGLLGGGVGAIPGAIAGGAAGEALKEKASGESASGKKIAKEGAVQGAWELAGGAVGQAAKGVGALAKAAGIDEAMMKFALKTGEDLTKGLNPAAAFAKWNLAAATTKQLWEKTAAKAASIRATKDALIDQAMPTSSTIRPYAIIKHVIDDYRDKAIKTLDPQIKAGLNSMLDELEHTYGAHAQSVIGQNAAQAASLAKGAPGQISSKALPTERLMTIKDADKLKSEFGDTVNWGKKYAENKLEDVYRAEVEVRKEIYGALNSSIKDAAGGNSGRALAQTQNDLHNVLEAKRLLEESAASHAQHGRTLTEILLDSLRRPGPASQAAGVARGAQKFATGAAEAGKPALQVIRNRELIPGAQNPSQPQQ
jgi:hypothetical protein